MTVMTAPLPRLYPPPFAPTSAAGVTDVGMVRDANEDTFFVARDGRIAIVCDGMGGHAAGEIASGLALEAIRSTLATDCAAGDDGGRDGIRTMAASLKEANAWVHTSAAEDESLRGMGTTAVAVSLLDAHVVVGHVGDSRCYRWNRGAGLERLTRDHSLLNYLIDRGRIAADTCETTFEQSNIIARALGNRPFVVPSVKAFQRHTGDLYLLCSDGLTDLVADEEIDAVVGRCCRDERSRDLEAAVDALVTLANARGGSDNITVVIVTA